jgi:hypothetical protein
MSSQIHALTSLTPGLNIACAILVRNHHAGKRRGVVLVDRIGEL